ncbi:MAG: glycoside hydrolase family 104 protein [Paludibacter sp.]|nr:glycoside hydrolase family 104 protein [Paludibacter sp.]
MTTEQLERWKRLGIPFDDAYVRLAEIGDKIKAEQEARKAREAAKAAQKELSIKFIGCKTSENNTGEVELTFEVTAKNLQTDNAIIYINGIFLPLLSTYSINPNGKQQITVSVPQNMIITDLLVPYLKHTAIIACDGLSAVSEFMTPDPYDNYSTKDSPKAPEGYYYAKDGTLLGQIIRLAPPIITDVMLFDDSTTKDEAKKLIYKINKGEFKDAELIKVSSGVGMKNEELNLRAFLTLIRQAEAGGTKGRAEVAKPLAYNIRYGNFTFDDYSKHPNILYSGPGYSIPSTAAGAYQFIYKDWESLGFKDFSPENQDKGALVLIKRQEEYNSRAKGIIIDIETGNVENAAVKLHGTWPSLPGGSQEKIGLEDAKIQFVKNIANELKGETAIKSKKGTLLF